MNRSSFTKKPSTVQRLQHPIQKCFEVGYEPAWPPREGGSHTACFARGRQRPLAGGEVRLGPRGPRRRLGLPLAPIGDHRIRGAGEGRVGLCRVACQAAAVALGGGPVQPRGLPYGKKLGLYCTSNPRILAPSNNADSNHNAPPMNTQNEPDFDAK